jgi:hypothetical protein
MSISGPNGQRTTFKYPIRTSNDVQQHNENGDSDNNTQTPANRQRGTNVSLLIHSDGGESGTTGCIGVANGDYASAKAVDDRLQAIFRNALPKAAGDTERRSQLLPIFVVGPSYTNSPNDLTSYLYVWSK